MSTLNIRRITSSSDALYSGCVRIYEESFPYEERRDTAVMTGMLSDDRFHFIVFIGDREEDGPVGFFTFWDFGHGYLYGEHFAVDPSRRGGGTGTISRWTRPVAEAAPAPRSSTTSRASASL